MKSCILIRFSFHSQNDESWDRLSIIDTVITNVKEKYLLQNCVAERGARCYFHLRHEEDTKGSRIWPSLYWYKHP